MTMSTSMRSAILELHQHKGGEEQQCCENYLQGQVHYDRDGKQDGIQAVHEHNFHNNNIFVWTDWRDHHQLDSYNIMVSPNHLLKNEISNTFDTQRPLEILELKHRTQRHMGDIQGGFRNLFSCNDYKVNWGPTSRKKKRSTSRRTRNWQTPTTRWREQRSPTSATRSLHNTRQNFERTPDADMQEHKWRAKLCF